MSAKALTYYDVLRVDRHAAQEIVRSAYRQLARRYHPDHAQDDADAHRLMAELNAAYAVLSDPGQRALYDRRIDAIRASREQARANFVARLEDNGARWPWVLLFATITACVISLGVTFYTNRVPSAATPIVKAFAR